MVKSQYAGVQLCPRIMHARMHVHVRCGLSVHVPETVRGRTDLRWLWYGYQECVPSAICKACKCHYPCFRRTGLKRILPDLLQNLKISSYF